jgi:hypothetical protein
MAEAKPRLYPSDPTANEMRAFLRQIDAEADEFDVEGAIYWFASDWHSGQSSNLYSALSTSEYRSGATQSHPDDGAMGDLYDALEMAFGG